MIDFFISDIQRVPWVLKKNKTSKEKQVFEEFGVVNVNREQRCTILSKKTGKQPNYHTSQENNANRQRVHEI